MNSTRCLNLHPFSNIRLHQCHIGWRSTPSTKASGSFHIICTSSSGCLTGNHLLFISEVAGLNNHLYQGAVCSFNNCTNVFFDSIIIARFHSANIDNHIHFIGSGFYCFRCLKSLGCRQHGSQRKTNHTAGLYFTAL